MPDKTSKRSPACRTLGPLKETGRVPRPEPKTPKTVGISAEHTKPKVQVLEKIKVEPRTSPERSTGRGVLWSDRERVKPIMKAGVQHYRNILL